MPWHLRLSIAAILVALVSLVFAAPAGAGEGAWTRVGLEGKTVKAVAVNPQNPDILLVSAEVVTRLGDGNEAGTGPGLFRSVDRGRTWQEVTSQEVVVGSDVYSGRPLVVFDPTRSGVVYASGAIRGQAAGLYVSTDSGRSWTRSKLYYGTDGIGDKPQSSGTGISAIVVYPQRPGTVFVTGHMSRVIARSSDYGATWAALSPLPADADVNFVEVAGHPQDPRAILVGLWYEYDQMTCGGLYRSANGGVSWTRVAMSGDGKQIPPDFDFCPLGVTDLSFSRSGGTVYALVGGPLARSLDGGRTWKVIRDAPLWVPSGKGVMIRVGEARETGQAIWRVIANPIADAEVLIAEREPARILLSRDRGASFTQLGSAIAGTWLENMALDRANPQTLYAATSDGLWAYTFPARAEGLPKSGEPFGEMLPILVVAGLALTIAGLQIRAERAR